MKEFTSTLLGNISLVQFAATAFIAYLTAFTMLMFQTTKRDISSPRTPFKFSWSFLWCDQSKRIVGTALLILLAVRFSQKWIPVDYEAFAGFIIGLISDNLSKLIMSLRDKLTTQAEDRINKI